MHLVLPVQYLLSLNQQFFYLQIGNYIINLGRVHEIDKDFDYYHITIAKFNETQIHKFLPGEELIIFEHVIVDDPMEFLLSSAMRDNMKSMFTTTRAEFETKREQKDQSE
ncbi:hypothetical protein ATE47_01280 [Chryseobacterium sp. IHB B 17019]|nr:hypothetical protein ATE47_01280 [Chryseobacterium sp. IHB B 17019]